MSRTTAKADPPPDRIDAQGRPWWWCVVEGQGAWESLPPDQLLPRAVREAMTDVLVASLEGDRR